MLDSQRKCVYILQIDLMKIKICISEQIIPGILSWNLSIVKIITIVEYVTPIALRNVLCMIYIFASPHTSFC